MSPDAAPIPLRDVALRLAELTAIDQAAWIRFIGDVRALQGEDRTSVTSAALQALVYVDMVLIGPGGSAHGALLSLSRDIALGGIE